ncbi:MAG: hypothetical protein ABSB56_04490 [Nitrososphaerales archaeon]
MTTLRLDYNEFHERIALTKIEIDLATHPGSRYSEIKKRTGLPDSTLAKHLKNRELFIWHDSRYDLKRSLTRKNEKIFESAAKVTGELMASWETQFGFIDDPYFKVKASVDLVESNFVNAFYHSLKNRDYMEGFVYSHIVLVSRALGALILSLYDDPRGFEVAQKFYQAMLKYQKEEMTAYAMKLPPAERRVALARIRETMRANLRASAL